VRPDYPLVVFDLDGTLVDSAEPLLSALAGGAAECGLPEVDLGRARALVGDTGASFYAKLYGHLDPEQLAALQVAARRCRLRSGQVAPAFPGVVDLLRGLREEGFVLAVLSNGSQEYIERTLRGAGLDDLFSRWGSAAGRSDKVLALGELLGAEKSAALAVVGDRVHDLHAARQHGLPSVGACFGYGGDELEAATFRAETPEAVGAHLRRCALYRIIERALPAGLPQTIAIRGEQGSGAVHFGAELARFLEACGYALRQEGLEDRPLRAELGLSRPAGSTEPRPEGAIALITLSRGEAVPAVRDPHRWLEVEVDAGGAPRKTLDDGRTGGERAIVVDNADPDRPELK
jgi:phosphoglycolate phosphatase